MGATQVEGAIGPRAPALPSDDGRGDALDVPQQDGTTHLGQCRYLVDPHRYPAIGQSGDAVRGLGIVGQEGSPEAEAYQPADADEEVPSRQVGLLIVCM